MSSKRYLLAIETSCDETAASVIADDFSICSNVVASQAKLHERFGGVVPEIASRAHLSRILPVIATGLDEAEIKREQLAAIAATDGPGLVGSLLVGLTAAKTLAAAWELPLVTVDHIEAHLFACRLGAGRDVFPAVGLVVSGGHTNLYRCLSAFEFELLGSTIDDAAGEAFDKAARILGLPYPGGPSISAAAANGDSAAIDFPRPMANSDRLEFSFSGLKTAILYAAKGHPNGTPAPPLTEQRVCDLAASFQQAVVDVLVSKSAQAIRQTGKRRLLLGGGVAANRSLREQLGQQAERDGFELIVAPLEFCTDNAAMAALAWEQLGRGAVASLDCDVRSGLVRKRRPQKLTGRR
ncbi:tRNA (adenosine(37)-N6)-threonylcarbamoyltransferase complex transferase subunit TsaD [Stratiformator vulcanicus]|uniref:tRNA N6-adenosine threonylcarbamoyltransferase n=1 Tax=Stratiformator vulcanicus TaxID=2527980 RepID=A0A517R2C7_9PLAN|nr:tRNA (adenosine(37)-N6)-threonylcarbamoyltransferase complex transferase subunit TsaD [Stratiformator vulcanicus]QDT38037.1 tRNA N6-adenosine threonylcarbamoyltransferase [Stratiformator vulcanicus]